MPVVAGFDWPKEDVDRMIRVIHDGAKYGGMTLGQSVRKASNKIALSMGTSTKVSDKYRQFKEDIFWDKLGAVDGKKPDSKRRKMYVVESWRGGRKKYIRVRAKNVAELKRKKQVKIGRRGLAAEAWRRIGGRTGFGSSSKRVDTLTHKMAEYYTDVKSRFEGADPFAVLYDNLKYAEDALIGGPNTVESVLRRAAVQMEATINHRVLKRMGAVP